MIRKIYDSRALDRDDEDPFRPNEHGTELQAMRTVPGSVLSRLFVPEWLRYRAIAVEIRSPGTVTAGGPVPFVVTMTNRMPFPVSIPTRSKRSWLWRVDGVPEASHVLPDPPHERGSLEFGRGERKQFQRSWHGSFRVSEAEWEPADPGEYTISAGVDVDDPAGSGLYAETTVRIEPG